LGDLLQRFVGNHVANWDQILPIAEFAYNSSINPYAGCKPFESVTGLLPRKPIDIVSLPIKTRLGVKADAFAKHMCEIHDMVQQRNATCNESCTQHTDLQRTFVEFNEGDNVIGQIRIARYRKGMYKNIHYVMKRDLRKWDEATNSTKLIHPSSFIK
jgi:hypothetical protein